MSRGGLAVGGGDGVICKEEPTFSDCLPAPDL
jgi:hypothetical protein